MKWLVCAQSVKGRKVSVLGLSILAVVGVVALVSVIGITRTSLSSTETLLSPVIYVKSTAIGRNVGTSWADAFLDLQTALMVARSGQQIWVAAGNYKPDQRSGNRDLAFKLKKGVELYGGFSGKELKLGARNVALNKTILSGDLRGDDGGWNYYTGYANMGDNSRHVVIGSNTDSSAVIDGFTITGGNADGDMDGGGGMYNYYGHPTIRNCVFFKNRAKGEFLGGGAMYNSASNPTIIKSSFIRNKARYYRGAPGGGFASFGRGGALFNLQSNPKIVDSTFTENSSSQSGGGMFNSGSSPIITNCTFTKNSCSGSMVAGGAGMANVSNSQPLLTRCTFTGNSGKAWDETSVFSITGGGMYNNASHPVILSSRFENNLGSYEGGGIANTAASNPTIIRTVFIGNRSGNRGGGVLNLLRSNPTFENCLFARNSSYGIGAGGAMNNYSAGQVKINSCTFANNSTNLFFDVGGGLVNTDSQVLIQNSIFWGNQDKNGYLESSQILGSSVVINYSLIQGLTGALGGVGNIGNDPSFVDNANNNFHLSLGSPAIDTASTLNAPFEDLDGKPRPRGLGFDMGAYEY